MRYRIRKKGKVDVVEKIASGRVISRTLDPEKVWNWAVSGHESGHNSNESVQNNVEIGENEDEKGAQELLSEPSDDDIEETLRELDREGLL